MTCYMTFFPSCLDLEAPVDMAMIISGAFTKWHMVAQAPRLWAYITIAESKETTAEDFQQTLHRVVHYPTRSRSLEVEVTVTLRGGSTAAEQHPFLSNMFRDHTRSLSILLAPHFLRLRRFAVTAEGCKLSTACRVVSAMSKCLGWRLGKR